MQAPTSDGVTRADFEHEVDLALAGSFPASDPPPWTLGAVPPTFATVPDPPGTASPAAVDVVIAAGDRYRLRGVVEAIGLVALLPLGVLFAALPILLLFWAVRVAAEWLLR